MARRPFGCSADGRRNSGADVLFGPCPAMIVLAVVARVGDNVFDRDVGRQLIDDGFEVYAIASRPACWMD